MSRHAVYQPVEASAVSVLPSIMGSIVPGSISIADVICAIEAIAQKMLDFRSTVTSCLVPVWQMWLDLPSRASTGATFWSAQGKQQQTAGPVSVRGQDTDLRFKVKICRAESVITAFTALEKSPSFSYCNVFMIY